MDHATDPDVLDEPPEDDLVLSEPTTLRDRVRAAAQSAAEDREPLRRPVPGYDGELVAVYRYVDPDDRAMQESMREVRRLPAGQRNLAAYSVLLAHACVDLELQDSLTGQTEPLAVDGLPVGLGEERAAEFLRIDPDLVVGGPRAIVYQVFKRNANAIGAEAVAVSKWLGGATEESIAELLGE